MNELPHKKRRRWLSFSLRGMLVLITILCVFLGWIGPKWMEMKREEAAARKIQEAGGWVIYDYHKEHDSTTSDEQPVPHGHYVLRYLFGEHIFSRVVEIFFRDEGSPNRVAAEFTKLKQLNHLAFLGRDILTDESIDHLIHVRNLATVRFFCASISPEQLKTLSQVETIEHLSLDGKTGTDFHLAQLPYFNNLKSLRLDSRFATDIGMQSIGNTESLEELELYGIPNVTDQGVSALTGLRHLKKVETLSEFGGSNRLTENCLPDFVKITSLENLYLSFDSSRVDFREDQYQNFASLKNLKHLNLSSSNIRDAALCEIGRLDQLKSLDLSFTHITDEGLSYLSPLSHLTSLSLHGSEVTDEGLSLLPKFESLCELSIYVRENVTEACLNRHGFHKATNEICLFVRDCYVDSPNRGTKN